jgi:hypothetical protein
MRGFCAEADLRAEAPASGAEKSKAVAALERFGAKRQIMRAASPTCAASGLRQEQKALREEQRSIAVWSAATKKTTDPLGRATGPF